ncbi:MAG: ferritin-like fold-containing protein [Actinomycetota bacterium]
MQQEAAVVDVLAVIAYGELSAFHRIAADLDLAPTVADKINLAQYAGTELTHYHLLAEHLTALGVEPAHAMLPFIPAVDAFHERTKPSTWMEGLVKTYVGDAIAADFFREIAEYLDHRTHELISEVLVDLGHADFAERAIRRAIEIDPTSAGSLALWGRRLVGEALSQAQSVAAQRVSLVTLLLNNSSESDPNRIFNRLTQAHRQRMQRLGLSA